MQSPLVRVANWATPKLIYVWVYLSLAPERNSEISCNSHAAAARVP